LKVRNLKVRNLKVFGLISFYCYPKRGIFEIW
jgi:hypothetical protein